MKNHLFKYVIGACLVLAFAGILAFTIQQMNTVTLEIPLTVGNRWTYRAEALVNDQGITSLERGVASIRVTDQIDPINFLVNLTGQADDGRSFDLTGRLTKTDFGILGSNAATFDHHRNKGFLLPRELEIGQILTASTASGSSANALVMRIEKFNQSVIVPGGAFDNAIEISLAVEIKEGRATGRAFLVPDLGVVKIEGTFSALASQHGRATLELLSSNLR